MFQQNSLTVAEYTDQFEDLMADVQDENSHISEAWFVRCYVNGLRSSIKYQLRPLRPTSLTEAYWLAVDMEQAIPVTKQYSKYSTVGNSKVQFRAKDNPFFDRATESKPQHTPINKVRDSAKCWRCGDNWFHGHKCKQAPTINLLDGEDPESAENNPEEEQQSDPAEQDNPPEHT
jgi:hypothetical protein